MTMEEIGKVRDLPVRYDDIIPSLGSLKGLLLGMSGSPLFLVSVYFFKASLNLFSREHCIAFLAYICSVFLVGIGIQAYGFPIVVASFQVLPIINQAFVSSLCLNIETFVSVALSVVSLYFASVGYADAIYVGSVSWIGVGIVAVSVIGCVIRLCGLHKEIAQKTEKYNISDLNLMMLFSLEAGLVFVSVCSLAVALGSWFFALAGALCMCIFFPIEQALYYYPATAVIPIFTVVVRIFGAILATRLYQDCLNPPVVISVVTGMLASFFPLMLL
ncbi:hypothetical protein NEDG_01504 [Nematocida displodere]|uniref:Uncharacterized protein n=1 Tax=Nematocida displodere TaxID=1805483 RepID=A0A177EDE3_9MICR|nr:hypothetical protein NEDG_01504 [Nematocida displodere]